MKRTLIIAVSVVALVFGVISYATAADTGTTAVSGNVVALLELTAPGPVNLGDIDPESPGIATVAVKGKSNKSATMSASIANDNFTTLTSTLGTTSASGLRGGNISVNDTITGTVNWDVDPLTSLTGTITYSIVQN